MNNDEIFENIENNYNENIKNCEIVLSNLGITVRVNENEYKPLSQILEELSMKWSSLTDPRGELIKEWICKTIAGIRNSNFLNIIIENLHRKSK